MNPTQELVHAGLPQTNESCSPTDGDVDLDHRMASSSTTRSIDSALASLSTTVDRSLPEKLAPIEESLISVAVTLAKTELPEDLVTIREAATILDRDVNAVEYRIKTGVLRVYQGVKGPRKVSRAALTAERDNPRTRSKARATRKPVVTGSPSQPTELTAAAEPAQSGPEERPSTTSVSVEQRSEPDQGIGIDHGYEDAEIPIGAICFDDSLQVRAKTDRQVVDEYLDLMLEGHRFPAVDVFREGDQFLIADGHHRIAAAKKAGFSMFPARVHAGGRMAALLWAFKSNTEHGLKLTNADKQRKVRLALATYPRASNNQIAEMCAVSEGSVRNARRRLVTYDLGKRIGADGKEYTLPTATTPLADRQEKLIYKQVTKLTGKLDQAASCNSKRRSIRSSSPG